MHVMASRCVAIRVEGLSLCAAYGQHASTKTQINTTAKPHTAMDGARGERERERPSQPARTHQRVRERERDECINISTIRLLLAVITYSGVCVIIARSPPSHYFPFRNRGESQQQQRQQRLRREQAPCRCIMHSKRK